MKEISTMNQEMQRKPAKSRAITSIALAVAMVAGGLTSLPAEALVLGQVRVLSHLGEPLKAEIPITQLSKDEGDSLMVGLASPSDFSSRGLIYTSTLSTVRVSYELTGKNTAVIHIRSTRPMQDPFIDMLMDVRWRAGNLQRSYTMLVDPPPSLGTVSDNAVIPRGSEITPSGTVAPITAATPQAQGTSVSVLQGPASVSPPATTTTADGVVVRERILGPGETRARPSTPQTTVQPSQAGSSAPASRPTTTAPTVSGSDLHIKVERGQTLGRIANSMKPANVTTEQMLAALYKANPSAFINNNINWLRSGATLRIPSDAEIAAISRSEARSLVSAHARQFNQRRAQMQQTTPTVVSIPSTGQSTGAVTQMPAQTTRPDDRNELRVISETERGRDQNVATLGQTRENRDRDDEIASAGREAQDIITAINSGTSPSSSTDVGPLVPGLSSQAEAERLAAETEAERLKQAAEAERLAAEAEAERLRVEAERLATDTEAERLAAEAETERLAAVEAQRLREAAEAERLAAEAEAERLAAEQASTPTPATTEREQPVQTPAPAPLEKGLLDTVIDTVMDNIVYIGAGLGAIVVLLGGLIFMRRRKNADLEEDEDDSFFEEEGDSYYGREEQGSDSFMLDQSSSIYAASQLDANADVDPVQEADVYLAYGRDEQAAEILRDALSADPDRIALHAKLCEVYARQNDIIAFEQQAMRLHSLTKGTGFEWERIARLAQSISPNKIGALGSDIPDTKAPMSSFATTAPIMRTEDTDTQPMEFTPPEVTAKPDDAFADLDVSLDFSKSVNPEMEHDPFSDSSDAPSFAMEGDDEDEGPATRLALAEEFFAIGNKEDAKEIIEEVMKQKLSDEDKKRAASLMNKIS